MSMSTNNTINKNIEQEFYIHKDILQIKTFNDSYYLMTTKIMKTFKWISIYCSNAKYIMRINDDVVVNTFELIKYFKKVPYQERKIYGKNHFGSVIYEEKIKMCYFFKYMETGLIFFKFLDTTKNYKNISKILLYFVVVVVFYIFFI